MQYIINILGTEYKVYYKNYDEDSIFKDNSFDGYCDEDLKMIYICNMSTYPGYQKETKEKCNAVEKATLRHELIHAILSESGLSYSSLQYSSGWAKNEEMVDFFAIQYPKIEKIMQDAEKIHNQHITEAI